MDCRDCMGESFPRDTKSLVASVSAKRLAEPEVVDSILDEIQEISDKARLLLGGRQAVDRPRMIGQLQVSHCLGVPSGSFCCDTLMSV